MILSDWTNLAAIRPAAASRERAGLSAPGGGDA
jgi:hypothetical protein